VLFHEAAELSEPVGRVHLLDHVGGSARAVGSVEGSEDGEDGSGDYTCGRGGRSGSVGAQKKALEEHGWRVAAYSMPMQTPRDAAASLPLRSLA
jgi:hypothetical protein